MSSTITSYKAVNIRITLQETSSEYSKCYCDRKYFCSPWYKQEPTRKWQTYSHWFCQKVSRQLTNIHVTYVSYYLHHFFSVCFVCKPRHLPSTLHNIISPILTLSTLHRTKLYPCILYAGFSSLPGQTNLLGTELHSCTLRSAKLNPCILSALSKHVHTCEQAVKD